MKISNPYITNIRTNHEQPLEAKKIDSAESNKGKTIDITTNSPINTQSKFESSSVPREIQQMINTLKSDLLLNSEIIQQLTEFVMKAEGTLDQKLETLKMLLNKNLEINPTHLKAIHQALHGSLDFNIKEASIEQLHKQNMGDVEITERDGKLKSERGNKPVHSMENIVGNKQLLEGMIDQVKANMRQGLSINRVIENAQNLINKLPDKDVEFLSKVDAVLAETQGVSQGTEEFQIYNKKNVDTREYLLNRLEEISHTLEIPSNSNSLHIQSKDIIVNTVSKKLAEATVQFRDIKREIARNLDQINTVISQPNKNNYQNVKSLLESAINKLDQTILKSDIIYLTDMKTEKALMQASSRLSEAKAHLESGNQPKVMDILREVKQTVDQLKWQPSDVKIKHFVAKESLFLNDTNDNNWTTKYSELTKNHLNHQGSARGMFELLRSQGLNHDSEIAQSLAFNPFDSPQEDLQKNMKAVILKVLDTGANETKSPEVRQATENILLNITGQQLLSKFDTGSNLQSMFFHLPAYIGEKIENIKVYINSRKDGEKIDWENSSLYFLIETKKLGETGILVSATNRNLSITIKNDHPDTQKKFEDIVVKYKERIQEIGYQVSGIHFKRLNELQTQYKTDDRHLSEKKTTQPEYHSFSKEGYDFRI